jgi:hypothetical protein
MCGTNLVAHGSSPFTPPKAICGEDNVIYVEADYRTDEETLLVGDHRATLALRLWRRPISLWL